jgi:hypothetical protein
LVRHQQQIVPVLGKAYHVEVTELPPVQQLKAFEYCYRASSGELVTYAQFLYFLVNEDETFLSVFCETLRQVPFAAFFWECHPVNAATVDTTPLTFVCIEGSSSLNGVVAGNPASFRDHFARCVPGETVTAFPNLGKDATMVVPVPPATGPGKYFI